MDICGYELPINLQNFTQKDLTEIKILQKFVFFLGGATFWNTLYTYQYGWGERRAVRREDADKPSVSTYCRESSERKRWFRVLQGDKWAAPETICPRTWRTDEAPVYNDVIITVKMNGARSAHKTALSLSTALVNSKSGLDRSLTLLFQERSCKK